VFLEPSCVGPPTLSCRVVSHMTGDSRSSRHGPPMKFFHLSTTSAVESDLRRGFLSRLCCVPRFSQPLDALFRPHPFDLISCRYRPGFHLQSLPLTLASCASRHLLPLLLSYDPFKERIASAPGIYAVVRSVPFCSVLPEAGGRSSHGVCPSEVSLARSRRPSRRLLSWAST
jgi:hypothetical protein